MFWIIAIVIGSLFYGLLLFSLAYAAKRGDKILSENGLMDAEMLPKAPLPFYSSRSLEEAMEIVQKMLDNKEYQDQPVAQSDRQ